MGKWSVNKLIPKGHAVLLLGQPHSLKSWLAEHLATCVIEGKPLFDKFNVEKGSAIIIDEDTPTDTLDERLQRLASGMGATNLAIKKYSMQGFSLQDEADIGRLKQDISEMKPPVLVVLDNLSSLMGRWNENSSADAIKATRRWNELKATGATLLIPHHMTLKKHGSYEDFDFTGQAMGSTYLIAKCDTAIGMWRVPPEKPTRSIVKIKPRRTAISLTEPFCIELVEPDDMSWARLRILEELPVQPSEIAKAIFPLFNRDRMVAGVYDVRRIVQGDYSDVAIREALHELGKYRALVKETGRGSSHRFTYKLNPDFDSSMSLTTGYWDELRKLT